ncbi:MAG: winged helix DNA-binding protein [Sphaerochaetaceae bacterium]|nr:winged helix DNA-binding protein [Sphaerochaetaceae bacterium]MDC7237417.1 winged helix DNA-binding protein [Sphaerochaetaceae bacterium]
MENARKSILTYIEYSRKITTIIMQKMAPVRKKYKLTKLDANALIFFAGDENPPIASEFSKCGSYSKSNVSKAISNLAQKNLVIMESNQEDRRYQKIQLTDEGKLVAKELRDTIEPIINKLSKGISPEQKNQMIIFLTQLKDNINEVMKDIE